MAIKLNVSEKQRNMSLEASNTSPYYVGATAYVTQNEDGATIVITDKDGTTTANVLNGQDGQDGNDGFSPIATVVKSGDTATITITDNNGTTTASVVDGGISDVTVDGTSVVDDGVAEIDLSGYITSPNVPYCTCDTAAGTAAKTATIVSGTFTEANLIAGAQVLVKFTNSNTVASPTLAIGSTTAKDMKRYGATAPSTTAISSWNAGAVVLFVYDGSYWVIENWLNTSYSGMTDAEYQAGTSTSARTITPARLKDAIQYWEADPTVPSWAKEASKPSYAISEITGLSDLLKVTTVTETLSEGLAAKTNKAAASISMTEQTGYKAIGIVGVASGSFKIRPTSYYVQSNTAIYAGFVNWSDTAVTSSVNVTFHILWLKTS